MVVKAKLIPTNTNDPWTYKHYIARVNRQAWKNRKTGPELAACSSICKNCPLCNARKYPGYVLETQEPKGHRSRYYFDSDTKAPSRSLPPLPGARADQYAKVPAKVYTGLSTKMELPPLKRRVQVNRSNERDRDNQYAFGSSVPRDKEVGSVGHFGLRHPKEKICQAKKFQIVPDKEPNVSLEVLINDISKMTIAALLDEIDSQVGYASLFQEKLKRLFTLENQEVRSVKQLFSSDDVILVGTAKEKIADAALQAVKEIITGDTNVKATDKTSSKHDSGFSDYDLNSESGVQKVSRQARNSVDLNIAELIREEIPIPRNEKYLGVRPFSQAKGSSDRVADKNVIPYWLKDKIDVTMNAALSGNGKNWLMETMDRDESYLGKVNAKFAQRIRKCENCEKERRRNEMIFGFKGRGRLLNHSVILQQAERRNKAGEKGKNYTPFPRLDTLHLEAETEEKKRRKAEMEKLRLEKRREVHYTAAQQMQKRRRLSTQPAVSSKNELNPADIELRLAQEAEKKRQKEERDALLTKNRLIGAHEEAERRIRLKEQTEMIRRQAEDEERKRMREQREKEKEQRKRLAEEEAEKRRKDKEAEEERKKAEEARRAEDAKKAEEARRAEEAKKAEDARKKAEEAAKRKAEESKKAEEAKKKADDEARKKAEDTRRAEEAKKVEDARKRAEEEANRKAEEAARLAKEAEERDRIATERETSREMGVIQPMHQEEEVKRKFKIKDKIGEGAFAAVYAAELIDGEPPGLADPNCKDFALKVMDKMKIANNLENVKEEIKLHSKCDHPNIARLYDVYETPTRVYMVMEKVVGGDLFDAIAESVKFDETQTALIVKSLAEALVYLHSKQIVHRDIKPENILVEKDATGRIRRVKLCDFGLATEARKKIFAVCGTPTYVAPEILAEKGYGLEVDNWAVGVIAYILLCGFPPFRSLDRNQDELFDTIQRGEFEYLSPYWDAVTDSARDLIDSLIEVNIPKRMQAKDILRHKFIDAFTKDIS